MLTTTQQLKGDPAAAWIVRPDRPIQTTTDGRLAGLRFAVKDNINVAGWPTTAGCPSYSNMPAAHATVVGKLLDAGAKLVGKTNLDQFACGLNGTRSPFGPVPNAFEARYVSGGSSSGSAAAVATGEVDFALGTDTAGSGRVPAGLNNIVGLKPSRGLLSANGVVPAAQSVDCVSIFATTVGLAARVLEQLRATTPKTPTLASLTIAAQPLPSRFRFGVPSKLEFFDDDLAKAEFEVAIARLKSLGGTCRGRLHAPGRCCQAALRSALVAERYAAIRPFFDGNSDDIVEPVRTIIGAGRNYSAADCFDAQTRLRAFGQKAAGMWDQIDVLVVPTAPTHYTIAEMQADPVKLNRNLGEYTNFVNLLDYAALAAEQHPRGRADRHHPHRPVRKRPAARRPRPALPPRNGCRQAPRRMRCHRPKPSPDLRPPRRCRLQSSVPICPECP